MPIFTITSGNAHSTALVALPVGTALAVGRGKIEGPPVLQVLKLVASRSCIGLELRQNILCSGWFKRKALTVLVQDQRKKVRTVPAITRKKKINENDSLTGF